MKHSSTRLCSLIALVLSGLLGACSTSNNVTSIHAPKSSVVFTGKDASRESLRLPNEVALPRTVRIGVPVAAKKRYIFQLFAFRIYNTRARHNDSVYITCGLSVNGQKLQPVVKNMGNLNNGIHNAWVNLGPVEIGPNDQVVYEYALVNAGHGDPTQVKNALSTGISQSLDQSGLEEPWNSIAKAAVQIGNVLFFANCDGPVASDRIVLNGSQILSMAPSMTPKTEARLYHGGNSPSGCGSNSLYDVTWALCPVP